MKVKQICIVALVLVVAMLAAYASEDVLFFTKEDVNQSKYLDPSTTEVNFSLEDAKSILISEKPKIIVESINGELIDKDGFGLIWLLSSKTTDGNSIVAGINASSLELVFVYGDGEPKKMQGNGKISEDEALEIAELYLKSKLSVEKINEIKLEGVKYWSPDYKISYARIIRGIPSLSDGIQIGVSTETNEISSYRKKWSMDEDEIALIDTKPSITKEKATNIIKEYMSNSPYIGKEKANTVKIKSSTLVWKEGDDDKIHLAWEVRFVDSSFDESDSITASAWIDAHSGEILMFLYARD